MIIAIILGALALLGLALKLTGAIMTAILWLFIKLPVGVFLCAVGTVLCCTILLIPQGLKVLGTGIKFIVPGL